MTSLRLFSGLLCLFICTNSHSQNDLVATTVACTQGKNPKIQAQWKQLEKDNLPTLQKKAEKGDPKAQLILGNRYLCQFKNQEKALYWMKKSSDQKLSQAQFTLGFLYYSSQKKEEGTALIEKAAKNGLPAAQTMLGVLIRMGNPDKKQYAFYWDLRSAKQDCFIAQQLMPIYFSIDVPKKIHNIARYKWSAIALKNPETPDSMKKSIKEDLKRMEHTMPPEEINIAKQEVRNFITIPETDDQYLPTCDSLVKK